MGLVAVNHDDKNTKSAGGAQGENQPPADVQPPSVLPSAEGFRAPARNQSSPDDGGETAQKGGSATAARRGEDLRRRFAINAVGGGGVDRGGCCFGDAPRRTRGASA